VDRIGDLGNGQAAVARSERRDDRPSGCAQPAAGLG
jgi:hypothetical protein